MPRRDYDDDDDDRPRVRRRRHEDDDDDYDPRPRYPARQPSQAKPLLIAVGVMVSIPILAVAAILVYAFAIKGRAAPAQPAVANAPPPPVVMPMGPAVPGPAFPPAGPVVPPPVAPLPGPGAPANSKVTISNLRVQRGFAGKNELAFDYQFPGGRPIGFYTAVVMEPGSSPATADLHFLEQQGTITLSSIGPFGGNWRSGTQVYVANHAIGLRNVPSPISNTLTLP